MTCFIILLHRCANNQLQQCACMRTSSCMHINEAVFNAGLLASAGDIGVQSTVEGIIIIFLSAQFLAISYAT
jgi:hypothetical protein